MSKHKKRKHKRVADPHDDYMQKRHAYWAACAKKGELTEEQAHTCDELEMFVSAVIVFSDISPKDIEMFERAWSFRDVFLRFACQPEDDLEPSFYFHEEERYRAAGARLCVTFCGLADYRPIPRNTKGRPAYRASNVLLKIARNGKSPVPRSIRSTGLKLIWRCQSEWSCSQCLTFAAIPFPGFQTVEFSYSRLQSRRSIPRGFSLSVSSWLVAPFCP